MDEKARAQEAMRLWAKWGQGSRLTLASIRRHVSAGCSSRQGSPQSLPKSCDAGEKRKA